MSVTDVPIAPVFSLYGTDELSVLQKHLDAYSQVDRSQLTFCGTLHHFDAAQACQRLAQRGLATVQLAQQQDVKHTVVLTRASSEDAVVRMVLAGPHEKSGPPAARCLAYVKECLLPGAWLFLTEEGVEEVTHLTHAGSLHRSPPP